jgi:hypothetical protein
MMQTFENQQPSLFELIEETPRVALTSALKAELATLVEVLLGRDRRDARKGGSRGHASSA